MIRILDKMDEFSIKAEAGEKRRKGLTSIIENLRVQKRMKDNSALFAEEIQFGDTGSADALTESPTTPIGKPRRRRPDRVSAAANLSATLVPSPADFHNNNNNNNNNNNVKNERLSPGTPDTSSRSVTPSHPDTPPAPDANPMLHISGRNYSDFMRSLAAKYNNANPNEYFSRNGFPPPLDPRYKQSFPLMPALQTPNKEDPTKKPEFPQVLNPFAVAGSAMFPPLIDMSSTQALLAMVRTAKEAELQGLLKNAKRSDPSSPLDLSAAAAPPPTKRPRNKTPSTGSVGSLPKRAESESPKLHEDISHWTVEDVCNFVQSIDICAEYALNFKEQRIDGSGLPLLTEDHLTSTMNMKLGPALKLKSVLAKKLGSCSVCLHCSHCHTSNSPESGHTTGNNSDSGGNS